MEHGSLPRRDDGLHALRWFKWGALALLLLTVFSALVYWLLGRYYGRADWTPLSCLFMVVITLSTIGYGDWLDIKHAALAQWFTMFLAVVGVGVPAFVISNVTAVIVEGFFSDAFRRRRMQRKVEEMRGHIIVCGAGTTGYHIIEELVKTRRDFVAIDQDHVRLEQAAAELGEFPYLVGSAEDDNLLRAAGIERAGGLITCLTADPDNLYVTLSARALNPKLRIVSKTIAAPSLAKLKTAGADAVVNTTLIGGLRLVSEMVRPVAVTFLDSMIRDPDGTHRFEELTVAQGAAVEGRTIAQADLRRMGDVLVVALRAPGAARFIYNPKADCALQAGSVVVVLGETAALQALRPVFTNPAPPR